MKKIATILLGLSLSFGGVALLAGPQTDQPKAEKNVKGKSVKKIEKADKGKGEEENKGKGKAKGKGKSDKKKAEEPKAQ